MPNSPSTLYNLAPVATQAPTRLRIAIEEDAWLPVAAEDADDDDAE